jgi:hypothetical protein
MQFRRLPSAVAQQRTDVLPMAAYCEAITQDFQRIGTRMRMPRGAQVLAREPL